MKWLSLVSFFCFLLSTISISKHRNSKFYWIFLCLLLMLTAGLRNMGGSDYYVYEDDYTGFRSYDGNGLKAMFEIGYTSLVFVSNFLGLSYNLFILVYTIIVLWLLFKAYWDHSALPFLSLVLYLSSFFMYYNMIALRQMLPLVIMPYAIYALAKQKYIYFIFFVVLGALFHNSFLVVLLCTPFILWFKPSRNNLLLLVIVSVIIKTVAVSFIENLIGTSNPAVVLRLRELSGIYDSSFSMVFYSKTIVIAVFLIYNWQKYNTTLLRYWFNCYLLCLIITYCFLGNLMIFRLTAYFELSITFLIPFLINEINYTCQTRRILYTTIILISIYLFFRGLLIHDDGAFLNYSFYFL